LGTTLINLKPVIDFAASKQRDKNKIHVWAGGALVLGLAVVLAHTGLTAGAATALLWSGACLALGGLLGFLFGIPHPKGPIIINQTQSGVATIESSVGKISTGENPPATEVKTASPVAGLAAPTSTPSIDPKLAPPTDGAAAKAKVAKTQGADKPADQPIDQGSRESNLEQVSDWVTKLLLGGGLTQLEKIPSLFMSWGGYVAQGLGDPNDVSHPTFATALIVYFMVLGFIAGYLITKVELGSSLREQ
jgi:hypothetical protein